MTSEADRVYAIEAEAFAETMLADHLSRNSFAAECTEIIEHPALQPMFAGTTVRVQRVDAVRHVASATSSVVSISVSGAPRFVVAHELAHTFHSRANLTGSAHGPEWRATYVWLVAALYGESYAEILERDFIVEGGLHVAAISFPPIDGPLISALRDQY